MRLIIPKGVLSHKSSKESSSSQPAPPHQGDSSILEEFNYEILETIPTKSLLDTIIKRKKKTVRKTNILACMLLHNGSQLLLEYSVMMTRMRRNLSSPYIVVFFHFCCFCYDISYCIWITFLINEVFKFLNACVCFIFKL